MASLEAAMSTVAGPRLIARIGHWRYEFGLIAGVLLGTIGIGVTSTRDGSSPRRRRRSPSWPPR
jgi:hypothetical protein